MQRLVLIAILIALALQTTPTEWVRRHAVPLADVDTADGFADLAPLKSMIGGARIVALGEATHGTHEFFAMKRRLTEFLAREMGFTIFAMEANMPEAAAIDEFTRSGAGDAAVVVKGLRIWPWTTEELTDLVRWMRAYRAGGGRMSFAGVDVQMPQLAQRQVLEFLKEAEPSLFARASDTYGRLRTMPATDAAAAARDIRDALPAAASDWTRHLADFIAQSYAYRADASGRAREEAMAQNIKWLLDRGAPDTKVVVWAHNGHVSRQGIALGAQLEGLYPGAMVNIGFTTSSGAFIAETPSGATAEFALTAPPDDSLEARLGSAGLSRFAIDLRPARNGESAAAWLMTPQPFRFIGIDGGAPQFRRRVVPREFDVLIYFERTRASTLLK